MAYQDITLCGCVMTFLGTGDSYTTKNAWVPPAPLCPLGVRAVSLHWEG